MDTPDGRPPPLSSELGLPDVWPLLPGACPEDTLTAEAVAGGYRWGADALRVTDANESLLSLTCHATYWQPASVAALRTCVHARLAAVQQQQAAAAAASVAAAAVASGSLGLAAATDVLGPAPAPVPAAALERHLWLQDLAGGAPLDVLAARVPDGIAGHELPALLARLNVPLPHALWFATAVLGPLATRDGAAAKRQAGGGGGDGSGGGGSGGGSGGHRLAAGHAARLRRELGVAQVWTGALLALLSALAPALADAAALSSGDLDSSVTAGALPVATPEQPVLSPATEQQAYRGAASDGGGLESAAAAAAAGGPAPDSADAAAAQLVEAAGGDVGRLRMWWDYALRMTCYSCHERCVAPADVLDWTLARLEARLEAQPAAGGAAAGAGGAAGPALVRPPLWPGEQLVQQAALQLVGACIEDVSASWRGTARLVQACMALAAGADGACAQLAHTALGTLHALVLVAPEVLPSLEGLPQLAALLGARSTGGRRVGCAGSHAGPAPDSLTGLALRAVDAAIGEARALAAAVNPPLLAFSAAAAFSALERAAALGDAQRGLDTLLVAAGAGSGVADAVHLACTWACHSPLDVVQQLQWHQLSAASQPAGPDIGSSGGGGDSSSGAGRSNARVGAHAGLEPDLVPRRLFAARLLLAVQQHASQQQAEGLDSDADKAGCQLVLRGVVSWITHVAHSARGGTRLMQPTGSCGSGAASGSACEASRGPLQVEGPLKLDVPSPAAHRVCGLVLQLVVAGVVHPCDYLSAVITSELLCPPADAGLHAAAAAQLHARVLRQLHPQLARCKRPQAVGERARASWLFEVQQSPVRLPVCGSPAKFKSGVAGPEPGAGPPLHLLDAASGHASNGPGQLAPQPPTGAVPVRLPARAQYAAGRKAMLVLAASARSQRAAGVKRSIALPSSSGPLAKRGGPSNRSGDPAATAGPAAEPGGCRLQAGRSSPPAATQRPRLLRVLAAAGQLMGADLGGVLHVRGAAAAALSAPCSGVWGAAAGMSLEMPCSDAPQWQPSSAPDVLAAVASLRPWEQAVFGERVAAAIQATLAAAGMPSPSGTPASAAPARLDGPSTCGSSSSSWHGSCRLPMAVSLQQGVALLLAAGQGTHAVHALLPALDAATAAVSRSVAGPCAPLAASVAGAPPGPPTPDQPAPADAPTLPAQQALVLLPTLLACLGAQQDIMAASGLVPSYLDACANTALASDPAAARGMLGRAVAAAGAALAARLPSPAVAAWWAEAQRLAEAAPGARLHWALAELQAAVQAALREAAGSEPHPQQQRQQQQQQQPPQQPGRESVQNIVVPSLLRAGSGSSTRRGLSAARIQEAMSWAAGNLCSAPAWGTAAAVPWLPHDEDAAQAAVAVLLGRAAAQISISSTSSLGIATMDLRAEARCLAHALAAVVSRHGSGMRPGNEGHRALLAAVRFLVEIGTPAPTALGGALEPDLATPPAGVRPAAGVPAVARAWLLDVLCQLAACLAVGAAGCDADALLQQALVAVTLHLAASREPSARVCMWKILRAAAARGLLPLPDLLPLLGVRQGPHAAAARELRVMLLAGGTYARSGRGAVDSRSTRSDDATADSSAGSWPAHACVAGAWRVTTEDWCDAALVSAAVAGQLPPCAVAEAVVADLLPAVARGMALPPGSGAEAVGAVLAGDDDGACITAAAALCASAPLRQLLLSDPNGLQHALAGTCSGSALCAVLQGAVPAAVPALPARLALQSLITGILHVGTPAGCLMVSLDNSPGGAKAMLRWACLPGGNGGRGYLDSGNSRPLPAATLATALRVVARPGGVPYARLACSLVDAEAALGNALARPGADAAHASAAALAALQHAPAVGSGHSGAGGPAQAAALADAALAVLTLELGPGPWCERSPSCSQGGLSNERDCSGSSAVCSACLCTTMERCPAALASAVCEAVEAAGGAGAAARLLQCLLLLLKDPGAGWLLGHDSLAAVMARLETNRAVGNAGRVGGEGGGREAAMRRAFAMERGVASAILAILARAPVAQQRETAAAVVQQLVRLARALRAAPPDGGMGSGGGTAQCREAGTSGQQELVQARHAQQPSSHVGDAAVGRGLPASSGGDTMAATPPVAPPLADAGRSSLGGRQRRFGGAFGAAAAAGLLARGAAVPGSMGGEAARAAAADAAPLPEAGLDGSCSGIGGAYALQVSVWVRLAVLMPLLPLVRADQSGELRSALAGALAVLLASPYIHGPAVQQGVIDGGGDSNHAAAAHAAEDVARQPLHARLQHVLAALLAGDWAPWLRGRAGKRLKAVTEWTGTHALWSALSALPSEALPPAVCAALRATLPLPPPLPSLRLPAPLPSGALADAREPAPGPDNMSVRSKQQPLPLHAWAPWLPLSSRGDGDTSTAAALLAGCIMRCSRWGAYVGDDDML